MPQKKKTLQSRQGKFWAGIKRKFTLNKVEVLSPQILKNNEPDFWSRVFNAVGEFKLSMGLILKLLFASKIGVVLMFLLVAVPMTAFEAHVVNVTATIERRPCEEFEVRSLGFWRNHEEERIFPQTVGNLTVTNDGEANDVFNLPNNVMANKLKKQLLAMKFSIAYFGAGLGTVGGGDPTTLSSLVNQADAALLADPQNPDQIAYFHNLIEEINTSHTVSTCPGEPVEGVLDTSSALSGSSESGSKIEKDVSGGEAILELSVDGADILDAVSNLISDEETSGTAGDQASSTESITDDENSVESDSSATSTEPEISTPDEPTATLEDSTQTSDDTSVVDSAQTQEPESVVEPQLEEPVIEPEPTPEPEPVPEPTLTPQEIPPPPTEPAPTT